MMSLKPMSIAGLKKISNSPDETEEIGRAIAKILPKDAFVCLRGDLGAGKTTLIKGLVSELTGITPHLVNSPTFTYLNIYEGKETLYHFDCYRLKDAEDFQARGLDEYFGALCLIEWPERITPILPKKRFEITLKHLSETKREIVYEKNPL